MKLLRTAVFATLLLTIPIGLITVQAQDNGTPATVLVTRDGEAGNGGVTSIPQTISEAPAIQSEYARLQVGVSPAVYTEAYIDVKYPQVTSVSPAVQERINKELRNYANKAIKDVQKANVKSEDKTNVTMRYFVKSSTDGIFSVVISSYTIVDRAAHGINVDKGFTFNTTTGKTIPLRDFGKATKDKVTEAMNTLRQEKGDTYLFSDIETAPYVSGNFFSDSNRRVTLIYPQGELGPMSSGIVYIPLGVLK